MAEQRGFAKGQTGRRGDIACTRSDALDGRGVAGFTAAGTNFISSLRNNSQADR
jgi:hypothetical protein